MPNREGGYGGYSQQKNTARERRVRAPGSGNVRRGVLPPDEPGARRPAERPVYRAPSRPAPERRQPASPREAAAEPAGRPERPAPSAPRRRAAPPPRRTPPRRPNNRLLLLCAVAGILVVSGVITALLPKTAQTDSPADAATAEQTARLVAPEPYAGDSGSQEPVTLNWGTVGPAVQEGNYTYTALPAATPQLPELGKVTTDWFDDAAFLGDSLTVGFSDYSISVGNALIMGYTSIGPNSIVNRGELENSYGESNVPLDVLAEKQPGKLYILLGTNSLRAEGDYSGFINYYTRMIEEIQSILPDCQIYVQSVLPVRPEALADSPGLNTARLNEINAALLAICGEKGCYYLNLAEAFTDADGALSADYAESDGVHLNVAGYKRWVDYLTTHTPYNKNNPYQAGSTYYLSSDMLDVLRFLP